MTDKSYLLRFGYAPGEYGHGKCADCDQKFFGDKYARRCEACAETLYSQVSSVEAVADKHRAMTTVSEEAVRVAMETYLAGNGETVEADFRNALTAALPHLPGVGVKKLEWHEPSEDTNGCWIAKCEIGTYSVVNENGWYAALDEKAWGSKEFEWTSKDISKDTRQTAFDAAQADYAARILSALEPPAARKLALEEAFKAGAEWADECGSGESPYLEIAAKEYAIRALGTSCEQLNKAVSNVPDQQENEPGAHGERERVLEESLSETRTDLVILQGTVAHAAKTDRRWEGMYERVGSWIKRIDATLSSPDHNADADKLVEGDGWLPMTHPDLPLNGASVVMFDSFVPGKDGFGQVIARFDKTHGWHVSASVVGGKYIQLTNPTKWRPLFSAPSQEVAGS